MRKAEYKQVDTKVISSIISHPAEYDDNVELMREAWEETVEKQIPVMGMAYRDATPEEIAEMERAQAEMPEQEPSPEERLAIMEDAFAELCEVIFNG